MFPYLKRIKVFFKQKKSKSKELDKKCNIERLDILVVCATRYVLLHATARILVACATRYV